MADVLSAVQAINKELFAPQNDVGGKSAHEIVSMAAANAIQSKLAMHSNFEAVSQSVLALAAKKYAEAAAANDADAMNNWQTVMSTMTSHLKTEAEGFTAFNSMAEDLVSKFPKGSS